MPRLNNKDGLLAQGQCERVSSELKKRIHLKRKIIVRPHPAKKTPVNSIRYVLHAGTLFCNVHKLFLTGFKLFIYRSFETGDNSF